MLHLIQTTSINPDFQKLVEQLDIYLAEIDGDEHAFYAQLNKTDAIKNVIVAYKDDVPAGCGAFKMYDENTAEIKRMYVSEECRGQGISKQILSALESWAAQLSFSSCILETGKRQEVAVKLYQSSGYKIIPNFGKYENVENSVCMKKTL
jgi:putative acetyltransferase